MKQAALNYTNCRRFWIVLALVLMAVAIPAKAQKKNKNKNAPATGSGEDTNSAISVPDSQAIDRVIGEFLGYWQIGDTESMHKYSADNVVVVSGAWEPPVIGWDNYLKAYQAQRARVTGTQLERSNTFIKVTGNCGWATYQFVYVAQMDGKLVQYFGHTTLILMKEADRWVITMNHSSVVESVSPQPAAPMDSVQPASKP